MGKHKIKSMLKKTSCYLVFLFAFLCVGFVTNNAEVEAFEVTIGDSIDYSNKTIEFKVQWGVTSVSEIRYCFDNCSNQIEVKPNSFISKETVDGGDALGTYLIDISSLDVVTRQHTNASQSLDRSFNVTVYANAKTAWGLIISKEDEKTKEFVYSPSAPVVTKVVMNSTKDKLMIGDKIDFTVSLDKPAFLSDTFIELKIGGKINFAACENVTGGSKNSFKCSYVVKEGDSGKVSDIKIRNLGYIKGVYDNFVSQNIITGFSLEQEDLTVDGVKPYIVKISPSEGVFSSSSKVSVDVEFSETLSFASGYLAPTLKFKFSEDADDEIITCDFVSGDNRTLTYECAPLSNSQGVLEFVSVDGGSKIADSFGNGLDLTYDGQIIFYNTSVDNGAPNLTVTHSVTGCEVISNKTYCSNGARVTIEFKFSMDIIQFVSKDYALIFNGVEAKNIPSEQITSNSLKLVYTVNKGDDGELSVAYAFEVIGANGVRELMGDTKELGYYVDNKSPVLSDFVLLYNGEEVESNTIYGSDNGEITFDIKVEDVSDVTFDSSKVSLTTLLGDKLNICDACNIVSLKSELVDGRLVVKAIINGNNNLFEMRLKIEKSAITDKFGKTLVSDWYSNDLTLDTKLPEFDFEISYPLYKGYEEDDKWVLISGSTINFKITSNHLDLKDYCVSTSKECKEYNSLEVNKEYSYNITNSHTGTNTLYVSVRDKALNKVVEIHTVVLKNMFSYSSGMGTTSKNHSIGVDVSVLNDGEFFKYDWFKKGSNIDFSNSNITVKEDDSIVVSGRDNYNGEYNVCIRREVDGSVLCSEYVKFDNKIDSFDVVINDNWSNSGLGTTIIFNDSSTVKCVAVGKNYSGVNCLGNNSNVVVYKTSLAISPLSKYVIRENGVYYFYIEDAVGNKETKSIIIESVDFDKINIEIFNGEYGSEYNTNLELGNYKSEHKFLVTFDRNSVLGSSHSLYKYFFSSNSYTIADEDIFNAYYLRNEYRQEIVNPTSKSLNVVSPVMEGIYNLYIMAKDAAGNISFASLDGIKVDGVGPTIKVYDSTNSLTNYVGSSEFIVAFDYSFVVEDYGSKLDLNNIYYNWVDNSNNKVFESNKKYDRCAFDYNMCRVNGTYIEFGEGLFNPANSYKFELYVYDNGDNLTKFTSSAFKIDTTVPVVSASIDESKWYNNNSFSFTVSKQNNVGTLNGIAYCVNDCLISEEYDLSKFVSLKVNNPTTENKTISLLLNEGVNTLYVYAIDVFGNYTYEDYTINYDNNSPSLSVKGMNGNLLDLSSVDAKVIDFTISDSFSGVYKYCVYVVENNKECLNLNNLPSKNVKYAVENNGTYYIEVIDGAGNSKVYSVDVIGLDSEPISFELISSVNNKFTKNNVTITLSNMNKTSVANISDYVQTIDYVALDVGSLFSSYEQLFNDEVINIFTKGVNNFTNSFSVSDNKLYVVRVVDTAGNASYDYIEVTNIDRDVPIVDTNTYGDGSDRVYLYGANGNVEKNISGGYEYFNDTVMIRFGSESMKDKYTGYNSYLAVKVCFKYGEEACAYETYTMKTKLNANRDYLINNNLDVTAPYDFNGTILYYAIDGAGNMSDVQSISVTYASVENSPVVSYSVKGQGGAYGNYKIVHNEAYVSGSVKLKVADVDLSYLEIYSGNTLESRCYVSGSSNDVNCVKNAGGEIGFVVEGNNVYYYLNSGNYRAIAYDILGNSKQVSIYSDSGVPEIKVYKKNGEIYSNQVVGTEAVLNYLSDLYIRVVDDTFSYMNIDLYNSKTGDRFNSASRYSYVNDLGKCVAGVNCEHGASLNELLVVSTRGYDRLIITVYDKAHNSKEIIISYDIDVPEISLKAVGETVYVNGIVYDVKENNLIDVQIGANNRLTLDDLLTKVIVKVDGCSYSQIKNNELFSVKVYKDSVIYAGDIFASIGTYNIVISYRDEAGNVAESKTIIVRVIDTVKPSGEIADKVSNVEIKEGVALNGLIANDNYGLVIVDNEIVKTVNLGIGSAVCTLVSNTGAGGCAGNVSEVSKNVYKFMVAGTYTFVYTVSDISGNTETFTQVIYVNDNKGPVITGSGEVSQIVNIGNRNQDGSINVRDVVVNYPTAYDVGDDNSRNVEFVGLFSVKNGDEKYKVTNDVYKIGEQGVNLTYRFTKIGKYYLRFTSIDKSNNVSIFEYEIIVVDNIAPSIDGVTNNQIIEIDYDLGLDFDSIIQSENIVAKDNYDEDVVLSYDVQDGENNTYVINLRASDSSENVRSIVVYVNVIDNVDPTVGELVIDEATNSNNLGFKIVGGNDNSNDYWHEYKVNNGAWTKYDGTNTIAFGNGLSSVVKVCIKAVDGSLNESELSCKDVLVDTTKPLISGVSDAGIYSNEVTVSVSDDRLENVTVMHNDEVMGEELTWPLKLSKVGKYSIVARDALGNESVTNFIINIDTYMDVVNDLNADEYTVTSIDFDKRFLVKVDIDYNNNGDSSVKVNLDGINIKENDMIYILGVVPGTESAFVMFSASGNTMERYNDGVTLINYGNNFKEGVLNEDCLVDINDDYYTYLIIKNDVGQEPVIVEKDEENKDNSGLLRTGAIILVSLAVVIVGYQILKFKRRIRAA